MALEDEAGWELQVPKWRGLGLTDPVKAVEVSTLHGSQSLDSKYYRINGCCFLPSSKSKDW